MKSTFIIILIGRIFQVVISFLSLKVVTNYLSKENVAYYFLILSILNYFGLSLISPAGQYVNRKLHQWSDAKVLFNRLINHFAYVFCVSITSIPLIYIGMSYFELLNGLDPLSISLLIALGVFFNTLITTIVPIFNMLNYRISFVVFTLIWSSLSLVLSVLFIKVYEDDILFWFAGQVISQILVSIIGIYTLKKYTEIKVSLKEAKSVINFENIKSVLNFAIPLIFSTLLMWVTTDSFRFVLERTNGLEYVGLFSVGFAISQRFSYAIESIVQQVFFPGYYSSINDECYEQRSQAWLDLFYSSIPLYFITMICTIVASSLLIEVFSGPQYKEAEYFVIMGAIFHFFRKVSATFSMAAHSEMKTKVLVGPYFIGALFSSVVLYFNSSDDFYRPAIIVTVGSLFMCIAMVYNTRNLISLKWCRETAHKSIKNYFNWKF